MLSCTKRYVLQWFRWAEGKLKASEVSIRGTKIRVSWIHDIFKFEESAPFSYTSHNFQISECVGFEELAPFSYTSRNFDDRVRSGNTFAYVYERVVFRIHKFNAKPQYEIEPNRDLVLRDQTVLPEVRNRQLLPREYFSHLTYQNSFLIQKGNLWFPIQRRIYL